MTDASNSKRDFFISFTGADRRWARWLARTLAEEGYCFWFQDQDFAGSIPGNIEKAHEQSNRTIILLSDAYGHSGYGRSEWEMRYQDDPGGEHDLLVLFRVGPAAPPPLLRRLACVDLFGCQDETAARKLVLNRLQQAVEPGTALPLGEVLFPGVEAPFPVPPHNLPPANRDFVGREDMIARLQVGLGQNGTSVVTEVHAITGLGGVGKSQVALAYCYRHLTDRRLIWWVRAEELATLAVDYAGLAGPLGLHELPEQEKQIQAVKRELQASRGWLLVFDNAEDPSALRPYLPGTGGQVLITSRRADWEGLASTLPLDVPPAAEAIALLLGDLPADPAQREVAAAVAEELGYLPLALAQARAFVQARKVSIATYQQQLAAARPKVLAWHPASADYPLAVAQAWQASIDAAAQDCPAARPLLELLAFLAPEAIPRTLLGADLEALPESLRDPFERDNSIEALDRYSLIRADPASLTVHRLVQAVVRDRLATDVATARAACVVRLAAVGWPSDMWDQNHWPSVQALLPHALAAARAAAALAPTVAITAHVLDRAATHLQIRGAYAEAAQLFEQAAAIGEKTLGPEHAELAEILNNLAMLYRITGRYGEAEQLHQRALAIRQKVLGPEHPDVAESLNNIAVLYRATGRYEEAAPLFQRALAIREKALGAEHPIVAQSLNNLAEFYQAAGHQGEAEALYRRALLILEKALGPEHPNVGTLASNLASFYQATGRYREAEPLFQRALAIREKVLGPEHPDVAETLNNLAALYWATGRHGDAEPLYQRVLSIFERALGPEHPNVATAANNLANLYRVTGRYEKAEPLLQRALAISENALGSQHPNVALITNNLAELYWATGRLREAEPLFQRALAIGEKSLGPEHPDVARSLNNLAALYSATGRQSEAEPLYQRALAIREKALGSEHPDVAQSLCNLAELYRATARGEQAEPLYQRALAIGEKTLGSKHPDLAIWLNNLALLYQETGHYNQAEPLFQRALAILPPDHPNLALVRENYAVVLERIGRSAEAAAIRRQSEQARVASRQVPVEIANT